MARTKVNRRKPAKRKPPSLPPIPWRSLLVIMALVAAGTALFHSTRYLLNRPVRALQVESAFLRVSPVQVEAAVAPEVRRGFLGADLDRLRQRVEAIAWVDSAAVERRWPDTFRLMIREHTAAARWGDTGLLNQHGELFASSPAHLYPELPVLSGPPGTERLVAERYLKLRGNLAQANLSLATLTLDERWAWSFELDDGTRVELGRRDVDQRLQRFFSVVRPALGNRMDSVARVDLRYSNGFAVAWHGSAQHARMDLLAEAQRG